MTSVRKRPSSAGSSSASRRSDSDSLRWTAGLLIFIAGLYAAASVVFYFFTWKEDNSILNQLAAGDIEISVANPCGRWGAVMASWMVRDGFGLAGVLLPVIVSMLGVGVIRRKISHRTILEMLLVIILTSLTLGALFGSSWSVFGSGWGGGIGIGMSSRIMSYIGGIGMIILLVGGWILTGVFINRNFIDKVNRAGNRMEKIVDKVKTSVVAASHDDTTDDEDVDEEPEAGDEYDEDDLYEPLPSDDAADEQQTERESDDAEYEEEIIYQGTTVTINDIYDRVVPESMQDDYDPAQDDSDGRTSDQSDGRMNRYDSVPVEGADDFDPEQPSVEPDYEPGPFDDDGQQPEEYEPAGDDGLVVNVYEHDVKVLDDSQISAEVYDPMKDLMNYRKPTVDMLEDYQSKSKVTDEEIYENKTKIEETLKDFGIPIRRIDATVGPTVTLYEIVQAQGVKIAKIQSLQNDIAQSLKAESGIRIIAPIPGRGTVGIEVPNRSKQVVSMYSAVRSAEFNDFKAELPVVIGRTIQNTNFVFDLAKMPHLLVAGATGQGKSVGLNAIITSLLYKKHPSQLKFVMIDPKMVEFSLYSKIERHFLAKMASEDESIVTDSRKAVYTLNALCMEMDKRLELCKTAKTRNIKEYNEKFIARQLNPLKGHRFLPYIVVIIDEFADLIMTAKEVETPVTRLAQKARAVGIHLIIATQRPSVDVITGKIKANFPARIAFRVMAMIDSRTIIDRPGAEQLIGRGDMLLSKDGELTRIQCALVETNEVERIVDHIAAQQGYPEAYNLPDYEPESGSGGGEGGFGSDTPAPVKYDEKFAEIAREAVASGQISTSSIQRNYEVGFNRAGRIMMQLERAGIVGRQEGAKPRPILIHDILDLEARLQELGVG